VPYSKSHIPQPQHHRPSGRAAVRLDGRFIYLGPWGSPEARVEYDRLIRQWLDNGRRLPDESEPLTVGGLIAEYFTKHVEVHYRKGEKPTSEADCVRQALRPVIRLHCDTPADRFGPLALEDVRDDMVASGYSRRSINKHLSRIRAAWRWGVSRELVPPESLTALQSLAGLRRGRTAAHETEPVTAVAEADLAATLPHLSAEVRAIADLQLLSGCRPGEAVSIRGDDIDRTGRPVRGGIIVWTYRVPDDRNKTAHHGRTRHVPLGPRAQHLLGPRLHRDPKGPLFRSERGGPFSVSGYRQAIDRACDAAAIEHLRIHRPDLHGKVEAARAAVRRLETDLVRMRASPGRRRKATRAVELVADELKTARADLVRTLRSAADESGAPRRWHPHQLRHNAAERLERQHGIEVAQYTLGHSTPDMTRVYSAAHLARAAEAAAMTG